MKTTETRLRVAEIFRSIAGETTHAGRPAVFVRLSGCNLRCRYCDTRRALRGGRDMELAAVLQRVRRAGEKLVVVTGGEPLLQPATLLLLSALRRDGREVLLETNGSLDIGGVPRGVRIILDLKCPGSGQNRKNRLANLRRLHRGDEVKLVISDRRDFLWGLRLLQRRPVPRGVPILFSPARGRLSPGQLADWMLAARFLPPASRIQVQLHRVLWPGGEDGVPLWTAGR